MTPTAAQVRRACALLRWGSPTLAEHSGVAYEALCLAWSEDRTSGMSPHDLAAVCTALERAGVRFAFDAEGQPGAALVNSPSR